MIKALWLLPALAVAACGQEVPHVDDPHNIVVNGEEMSQADFFDKYGSVAKNKKPGAPLYFSGQILKCQISNGVIFVGR